MTIVRVSKTQGDLVFDLFDKYRVFYKQQSDIAVAKKFIQDRLDNNESVIFVALEAQTSRPIGFTQLYPKYSSARVVKNWILNDLYVHQDYRKKGIGERLIRIAMDFARENNSKFVELSTAVDNYTAQSLYEQVGFKKLEPETDFFTYRIDLMV
jgi:ribosomal protein S18 acetylase RimI-like enzyme